MAKEGLWIVSNATIRKGRRWAIVIALVCALALFVGWGWVKYRRVRGFIDPLLAMLPTYQAMAEQGAALDAQTLSQLAGVGDDVAQVERSLRGLRREFPVMLALCPHLGWVPQVGDELAAAPDLLDMGIDLVSGAWWTLFGLEPLLDGALEAGLELDGAFVEQSVLSLANSQRYFLQARDDLASAEIARQRIVTEGMTPRLVQMLDLLDQLLPLARMGVDGLVIAPVVSGAVAESHFLLLAQNSHELRPTGGLISGVGLLSTHRGEILQLSLGDSYDFADYANAHPPAPAPLATYMWAGVLLLRDANWSPDFPSSAQVVTSLYQMDRGVALDGVIAADLTAVELLIDAVGPLQLEGYEQAVTGANVIELLQQYWAAPVGQGTIAEQKSGDWWSHRKDIMDDMVQGLVAKVLGDPWSIDPQRALAALQRALDEKHILIYVRDGRAAEVLAENGWDGAIVESDGDYVMLVDANLGFNKVDANVDRRVDYRVDLTGSSPRAELVVRYENHSPPMDEPCRHEDLYGQTEYQVDSYEGLTQGCYWNYVRVLAPLGAELVQIEGTDYPVDLGRQVGRQVFGTFVVVPPDQSRTLRFVYDVAPSIVGQDAYHLLVQKQPGLETLPFSLTVLWPGQHAAGAAPDTAMVLRQDQTFMIPAPADGGGKRWPTVVIAALGLLLVAAGMVLRRTSDDTTTQGQQSGREG